MNHVVRLLLVSLLFAVTHSRAQSHGNQYPFAHGTIVKIDTQPQRLTLDTPDGLRVYAVTNTSSLIDRQERIRFDQLKTGTPVKLSYTTNGTERAVVRRLKLHYPAPPELDDKTAP